MEYFKKIIKESFIVLIFSSVFGLLSGTMLSINEEILYIIPLLLLILPALNSLIGDIATVSVARITTHLYIGTIPPKMELSERLIQDFFGLFVTLLLSLIILIGLGYLIGNLTGIQIINPFLIISIILITCVILFCSLFISLYIASIYLFKRGNDPNNFLIPFVTSLADFLTPFFLILFVIMFK